MLRISTNSDKFGVDVDEARNLLVVAGQLDITVKGVSFNFQEEDEPNLDDYLGALTNAKAVFDHQQ